MAATESGGNLERAMLWIVIGLFLTLSIIWAAYPRIYDHYHPKPKWPGELDSFGPSIAALNFWRACLLALLGFPQLRLRHCFHGVSTILFRVFLRLSLGMALDAWAFSFSIRFWTITLKELSPRSRYMFEISRPVWRYVTPTTFAIGLLNIGLAAFYRRRSSYRTQVSS